MRINAPARALTAATLAGLLLAGCARTTSGTATDPPTTAATRSPGALVTPRTSPTRIPTKKPEPAKPTRTAGNGDSKGDHLPATAGGGICADLGAAEVGATLGATVTGAARPGGGCTFTQSDDRRPAAGIVEASFAATPGGMAGAKNEATSSVEGDPVDLTGIGDAAFVVTGTAFGGPDIQGAGAVLVGDRLIRVNLDQSSGLSRAKVEALVVDLLKLVAAKA